MQDHLEVYVQYSCKQPVSLQPQLKMWRRPFIGAHGLFLRRGPGASNHFEVVVLHAATTTSPTPT
jgi:choline dehydrogenase